MIILTKKNSPGVVVGSYIFKKNDIKNKVKTQQYNGNPSVQQRVEQSPPTFFPISRRYASPLRHRRLASLAGFLSSKYKKRLPLRR